MKRGRLVLVRSCFIVVILVSFMFFRNAVAADNYPSPENLKRRNVALRILGFGFASGLRLNEQGQPNGNGVELVERSWSGSGFIVNADGTLVTNYHVARLARAAEAVFDDGSAYEIPFIKKYDAVNDIAVLKIRAQRQFPAVNLGDSNTVKVMDQVMAVGNTLGMGLNVTDGRISRIVQNDNNVRTVLRHTAAIAPGNSGGALYKGDKVVGVNVRVFPEYVLYEAVPINLVRPLLSQQSQNIPFANVFPTSLEAILKKAKQVFAKNGQVSAATQAGPGIAVVPADMYPLEDVFILVQAQQGHDLAMAVYDDTKTLIGFGDIRGKDVEAVFLSNDVRLKKIGIVVMNYDQTPVNFGLSFNTIEW